MSGEGGAVVHAYGVVPVPVLAEVPVHGIDGARVRVVEVGDVAVLVSSLDRSRYGAQAWLERAEDADWVAAFAAQHRKVLDAVVATTDVMPFLVPGMYDDEVRLREELEAQQGALSQGLASVAGQVQWCVQVFFTHAARQLTRGRPRTRSRGARRRRRFELAGYGGRTAEAQRTRTRRVYGRIAEAATRSVAKPLQGPAPGTHREPMLLNGAYLVPRDREEPFFARLTHVQGQLKDDGMRVEVSGPWPPYDFVHLLSEEPDPGR